MQWVCPFFAGAEARKLLAGCAFLALAGSAAYAQQARSLRAAVPKNIRRLNFMVASS